MGWLVFNWECLIELYMIICEKGMGFGFVIVKCVMEDYKGCFELDMFEEGYGVVVRFVFLLVGESEIVFENV